jgi:hypothetical protein
MVFALNVTGRGLDQGSSGRAAEAGALGWGLPDLAATGTAPATSYQASIERDLRIC